MAEFWNTLSNAWILVPPLVGIHEAIRHNFERRFMVGYLSLVVIGVGSTLFHATLDYRMQLLDEIPMIYGTAAIGYCLIEIRKPMGRPNYVVAVFLLLYCVAFTVVYLTFKNPLIHEGMFIVLSVSLIALGFKMNVQSYARKSVKLFGVGLACYALGGIVWNLDNHICPQLTAMRRDTLPGVMKPLSQLHAWWHFFSGYGTYLVIVAFIGYRLQ